MPAFGGGSVVVDVLFIFAPIICGGVVGPSLCVHSNFAIISLRKRMIVALLLLSSCCHVTVRVLFLFPTMSWVGLQILTVTIRVSTVKPVNSGRDVIFCL